MNNSCTPCFREPEIPGEPPKWTDTRDDQKCCVGTILTTIPSLTYTTQPCFQEPEIPGEPLKWTNTITDNQKCCLNCKLPSTINPLNDNWFWDTPTPEHRHISYKTPTINTGTGDWVLIARENDPRKFTLSVDLRYGPPNGPFTYKANVSGEQIFNNLNFGDPDPGATKYGWYRSTQINPLNSNIPISQPTSGIPVPTLQTNKVWYSINLLFGGIIEATTNNNNTKLAVYNSSGNLLQTNTQISISQLTIGFYYIVVAPIATNFGSENFDVFPIGFLSNGILLNANFTIQIPLFNSGLDNNYLPLQGNSTDPHYNVVLESPTPVVVNPVSKFRTGAWTANNSISKWIYHPAGIQSTTLVRTKFNLTSTINPTLTFRVLIANEFLALTFNGNNYMPPPPTTYYPWTDWKGSTITSGFVIGENVIDFTWNHVNNHSNYGGFRVEISGTENGIPINVFNTGVDNNHNVIADGQKDIHYSVIFPNPNSNPTVAPIPLDPQWLANDSISQWIKTTKFPSLYFSTPIDLSLFQLNTTQLSISFLIDTSLDTILFNDTPISYTVSTSPKQIWTTFTVTNITQLQNILKFVWNTRNETTPEPVKGVRVKIVGTGLKVTF